MVCISQLVMVGIWPKFFLFLFLFNWQVSQGQSEEPPNIILFLADDHGAEDAGYLGHPDLQTPVLDQLAREGMIFTRAYAPASVCAPSRSALFTGLYPHKNGCDRNHGSVRSGIRTLPDYLLSRGYRVVLAGKKHIGPEAQFAFEYIELHEVKDLLETAGQTPFCLVISMHTPHQPYFNHKGGYTNITPKSWMPDTRATRQYTAAYYDHVTLLDQELGSYLYWIEKLGFADALQIYTSDHGAAFPFGKWTLYEKGIRVPMIVKWNGKIPPGSKMEELVGLVDVLPTLVEVSGGPKLKGLDGQSFLSLFQNEATQPRQYLYATYTNLGVRGANEYPIRAIWSRDWKLLVNLRHDHEFHINRMDQPDDRATIDSYDVLQSWLNHEQPEVRDRVRRFWKRPAIEFYRLDHDPHEMHNLAMSPDHHKTLQSMLAALQTWMVTQGDPETENLRILLQSWNTMKE